MVSLMLLFPPRWLLNIADLNSLALAPQTDLVISGTAKENSLNTCNIKEDAIKCRINKVLEETNQIWMEEIIYKLAECENHLKEDGCGDNGASCGFLQFQEPTWNAYKCEGSRFNLEDSVLCATKLINDGVGHTTWGWKNCWRIQNLPI